MKKTDHLQYWQAFLHWKGWGAFAGYCASVWRNAISWSGWKKLFAIPFPLLLILCVGCGVALIWIFVQGLEEWIPAYFVYALSAYSLTAICIKFPSVLRNGKEWLSKHPKISGILKNKELKFSLELYCEQFLNFAYGVFKIVSGVVIGSAWIGADGIYNFVQALIQLFQILRRKNPGSIVQQWKSYRFCGVLILLMHLTLTGIVFQMVNWNRAEEHAGVMIFATAAFAFYKVINSFVNIAKDRKHTHPVDSSVRMLELAQAIFAIFSLQASLLHAFGTGEPWEGLMNAVTGCVVCLLVVAMGVYMVRRGNREIRKIKENENG